MFWLIVCWLVWRSRDPSDCPKCFPPPALALLPAQAVWRGGSWASRPSALVTSRGSVWLDQWKDLMINSAHRSHDKEWTSSFTWYLITTWRIKLGVRPYDIMISSRSYWVRSGEMVVMEPEMQHRMPSWYDRYETASSGENERRLTIIPANNTKPAEIYLRWFVRMSPCLFLYNYLSSLQAPACTPASWAQERPRTLDPLLTSHLPCSQCMDNKVIIIITTRNF